MNNIVIIGGGNIGSRHLQGLSNIPYPCNIFMIDPLTSALQKAEELFLSTGNPVGHTVTYGASFDILPKSIDVAIIATSSNVRKQVVEDLLDWSEVHSIILEKVLFQKMEDYDHVARLLNQNNVQAWVNCSRRQWKSYRMLKRKLESANRIELSVSGSHWGLACNAIHMLDLVAFLSSSETAPSLRISLDDGAIASKRKGYWEVEGTISGALGKCDCFSITCYKSDEVIPRLISITSDVYRCVIDETKEIVRYQDRRHNWATEETSFPQEYLSQISGDIVLDILSTGSSHLASFEESCRLHKALLQPLIKHFEQLDFEEGVCPIT